ncbi:hypothetical protein F4860DRAFT_230865 [Xylaria cubensis]|nr:hypothetical protein F4860DRAFT_230865 [Xylaria cubensis]
MYISSTTWRSLYQYVSQSHIPAASTHSRVVAVTGPIHWELSLAGTANWAFPGLSCCLVIILTLVSFRASSTTSDFPEQRLVSTVAFVLFKTFLMTPLTPPCGVQSIVALHHRTSS